MADIAMSFAPCACPTPEMVRAYFDSPWPPHAHPLRDLG
jgi:hypothetical protein